MAEDDAAVELQTLERLRDEGAALVDVRPRRRRR